MQTPRVPELVLRFGMEAEPWAQVVNCKSEAEHMKLMAWLRSHPTFNPMLEGLCSLIQSREDSAPVRRLEVDQHLAEMDSPEVTIP